MDFFALNTDKKNNPADTGKLATEVMSLSPSVRPRKLDLEIENQHRSSGCGIVCKHSGFSTIPQLNRSIKCKRSTNPILPRGTEAP